ncbi:hypothetical protein EJ02DRAFT_449726, partial [Clathrospora elynae]
MLKAGDKRTGFGQKRGPISEQEILVQRNADSARESSKDQSTRHRKSENFEKWKSSSSILQGKL